MCRKTTGVETRESRGNESEKTQAEIRGEQGEGR